MKHGNKLIAFLLITLLCMMSFLPGAVWAAEGDTTTSTEAVEKTEASEEKEPAIEKPEIIDTGGMPLLTIMDIEVPAKVGVGQEFNVAITVRNIGNGIAMAPELRFTEG